MRWFWEILHEMDDTHKRQFLMFSTGSDRSPLRGLAQLNFTITGIGLDDTRLVSAHTCFNDIILPRYSSKEIMKAKVYQSIQHCEGFGLI